MKNKQLKIKGLRENNLKEINLDLPHDKLVAVTGLSGSGKSSLAFDTVYAEGQRRYIETFSPYTRQFLDKLKRPDADSIEQVRPAIAIQQRTRISNSRSTVGSLTDINAYLRTLWCQIAKPHCPECGAALNAWTSTELAQRAVLMAENSPAQQFYLAVSMKWPEQKKLKQKLLIELTAQGYARYYNFDENASFLLENNQQVPLIPGSNYSLLILERFDSNRSNVRNLVDSINSAFLLGQGRCFIVSNENLKNLSSATILHYQYSNFPSCSNHQVDIPRLQPAIFSYNHPLGACPDCKGFGYTLKIDRALCVSNPARSIAERALSCWSTENRSHEFSKLLRFCQENLIPVDQPWHSLTPEQQDLIFETKSKTYTGVIPWFRRLERKIYKMHIRVLLSRYRSQQLCKNCGGNRLKPAALAYRCNKITLPELWKFEFLDLKEWLLKTKADQAEDWLQSMAVNDIFNDVLSRIQFLLDLGLGYLTLDRQARTLSNGETQRVNLAAALGSNLTATHFVLDEPSIGLHARDTDRLIASVSRLKDAGNSVLVVEHDPDFIRSADELVEIGPGSGANGGQVIYQGSNDNWTHQESLIAELERSKLPTTRKKSLHIARANARNLKNIAMSVPLNCLCVLSGVSGSGKSSLVSEVLLPAYKNWKNQVPNSKNQAKVTGFEHIDDCLLIDQAPLVKNPRANIATYSGIWDVIRQHLAATETARLKGFTASFFSFNSDGGRCPECKGAGYIKEDMQFLSDVFMPCELCLGQRFQPAILDIKLRGHNVIQLLRLTCVEIKNLFQDVQSISRTCDLFEQLGLGHLMLGHALSELSGGEAQRLKLVAYLSEQRSQNTLLIFDEPSSGLHVQDIAQLLKLFDKLIAAGNSILCIEHNLQIIKAADWIIDLGPEGGKDGGNLVFQGPLQDLLQSKTGVSYTADFLNRNGSQKKPDAKQSSKIVKLDPPSHAVYIKGAREHNLKNLDLEIPLEKIIAFVGVSGSGKTSLAKDILFAEGQRRYLDCLSPYARQFIKGLKKPDIDRLQNVPPSIYIGQHTHLPGRLSTVGTLSEIYNYLRLLYSKLGAQYCPDHPNQQIAALSAPSIASKITREMRGSIKLLAPIITNKKGAHREIINRAIESEISELRVDGQLRKTSAVIEGLERHKRHSLDYVVASCNLNSLPVELLIEAVDQALALGSGTIAVLNNKKEYVFSSSRSCPECQKGFYKLDPEDFSFSSRRGWCSKCEGSGTVPAGLCSSCAGSRINREAAAVKLMDKNIYDLCALELSAIIKLLKAVACSDTRAAQLDGVFQEVYSRIETLQQLGLDYLTLNQDCRTLSAGELQRVRLASALGSPLSGVLYLLDEPSASLHPSDNQLVLNQIERLKTNGNTVAIVEHDPDTILVADQIIELGPVGGKGGGQLIFNGTREDFLKSGTLTAECISKNAIDFAPKSRKPSVKGTLTVMRGQANNVEIKNLKIPLGQLIAIVGVSGAGKSSLVHSIICQTLSDGKLNVSKNLYSSNNTEIKSSLAVDRLVLIDQSPLGKNSRSTPAVYLKVWDQIRALLAQTAEARSAGWTSAFFSFNSGKGRCSECQGRGEITLEMSFLANASIKCESCQGRRFNDQAESVRYAQLSPSQILALTFDEAAVIFNNYPKIRRAVKRACEVGLGYLTLGQNSATLSGGEAQRLKIVKELSTTSTGHKIYIFDEPTTGLHESDVENLINILNQLVETGNSVIVIEHNRSVIMAADQVIELGPGPGPRGGNIVFQGSAAQLAQQKTPWGHVFSQVYPQQNVRKSCSND